MSQITFLDGDHVIELARTLLERPSADRNGRLSAFFAPEDIDLEFVEGLGREIREMNGSNTARYLSSDARSFRDAVALVYRRGTVDVGLMDQCPSLRFIQKLGASSDGIDLEAARQRGIRVSCLERYSIALTAEHALLLMLTAAKKLFPASEAMRLGKFDAAKVVVTADVAYNWVDIREIGGLYGQTLGIVGLGEVGRRVASRAQAFGMKVLYVNRTRLHPERETELAIHFRDLQALLAEADFVTLHAPNTEENTHLLDRQALSRMKPTAVLVNTSRGRLIDEDALYEALSNGQIASAGLDVHAMEPRLPGDRFYSLPNVVMTPHIAGGSRAGVLADIAAMFENIRSVLRGEAPVHGLVA